MGSPQAPDAAQRAALEQAAGLATLGPPVRTPVENGRLRLAFTLPRQGVSLLKVAY